MPVAYDIERMPNATPKQLAFLTKLLSEREFAGPKQHEAWAHAAVRSGTMKKHTAGLYIDLHLKSPRKRG
jgi:hypothetical protein